MNGTTYKKIIVIGCPGAGKSDFSRKLGATLDLPLIHLAFAYHQDIWPEDAAEKRVLWRKYVAGLVEQDRWIIDGNYKNTFDIRMAAAETIIFLDYPRWLTLYRMVKRRVQYHHRRRPDMPPNWKEKITWDFFKFVWNYRRVERSSLMALLDQHREGRSIFIVATPAEAERLLSRERWEGNSAGDGKKVAQTFTDGHTNGEKDIEDAQ